MARISDLSDELLIKIITFLPTKVAVSTSILSKQWQFLWMWLPKLEYCDYRINDSSALSYLDFIDKNLPLHRAPVIESLLLLRFGGGLLQPEKIKRWVGIALSRFVRELSIKYYRYSDGPDVVLPNSLYTCDSLMTLKLEGAQILVDVPGTACLPSLKTLQLRCVTYSNEDSLRLLLSHCPVLEDLLIERDSAGDNVTAMVVKSPSLQMLVLEIGNECSSDGRLSLRPLFYCAEETVDRAGIVFNQLEHLKLCIYSEDWSKSGAELEKVCKGVKSWELRNSPKLRVLNLFVDMWPQFDAYERVTWKNKRSSVPECLLRSLKTFQFAGFSGTQEEKDFLSFFFKHASCLKVFN
ncbi:unnamed protein product [Microthlaspi erraticum]|uniref:Uncharacterized protein n=1 Tax=Microthlaspi erraticum TaxID=1685480 RepID=A0A6D2K7Z0_9BRAS|nr:unnamed protein product [Microthlaspi erraticum]